MTPSRSPWRDGHQRRLWRRAATELANTQCVGGAPDRVPSPRLQCAEWGPTSPKSAWVAMYFRGHLLGYGAPPCCPSHPRRTGLRFASFSSAPALVRFPRGRFRRGLSPRQRTSPAAESRPVSRAKKPREPTPGRPWRPCSPEPVGKHACRPWPFSRRRLALQGVTVRFGGRARSAGFQRFKRLGAAFGPYSFFAGPRGQGVHPLLKGGRRAGCAHRKAGCSSMSPARRDSWVPPARAR